MSFKRLSMPVALVALVVLFEPPFALASRNTTRWRNFVQDPSRSDFTVSYSSGPTPIDVHEANDGLGVQRLGSTKRYAQSGCPNATEDRNPNSTAFATQTNARRVSIAVYLDSSVANTETVTPTTGSASALQGGAELIV